VCIATLAIVLALTNRAPEGPPGSTQQGAGITEASTARSVDEDSRPRVRATEFRTGEELFITFRANQVEAGQFVDLKMFHNNSLLSLDDTRSTFDRDANYNGHFSYTPDAAGSYRVELYFNGERTPSQTLIFTVR
jgi:hypothetical protein